MDQTTLAASLSIIGNALEASDQTAWISGGYFVSVELSLFRSPLFRTHFVHTERRHVFNSSMGNFPISGLAN